MAAPASDSAVACSLAGLHPSKPGVAGSSPAGRATNVFTVARECCWRAEARRAKAGRARFFLKNSPISSARKSLGEHTSKEVISLATSRHISRVSLFAISLSVSRCAEFGKMALDTITRSDHRPSIPEVALRSAPLMAWWSRLDSAPRTASHRRSLAARICRTDRRAAEYVSDVRQRTAADTASPARARHDRRIGACEGHRAPVEGRRYSCGGRTRRGNKTGVTGIY